MARVLVIEDEADLQEILRYNLGQAGHEVRVAATGKEGLRLAREQRPDIVLLDVMLPDVAGTSVCKQLKSDAATKGIHVMRFHADAPISAASTTVCVTSAGSAKPDAMVFATAVPVTAPKKLRTPAMRTAVRMGSTPVETTVAMALAASWKPLM